MRYEIVGIDRIGNVEVRFGGMYPPRYVAFTRADLEAMLALVNADGNVPDEMAPENKTLKQRLAYVNGKLSEAMLKMDELRALLNADEQGANLNGGEG